MHMIISVAFWKSISRTMNSSWDNIYFNLRNPTFWSLLLECYIKELNIKYHKIKLFRPISCSAIISIFKRTKFVLVCDSMASKVFCRRTFYNFIFSAYICLFDIPHITLYHNSKIASHNTIGYCFQYGFTDIN